MWSVGARGALRWVENYLEKSGRPSTMTQAWKIREITVLFSPVGANFRRLCANFRRFILIGGVFTAILGILRILFFSKAEIPWVLVF